MNFQALDALLEQMPERGIPACSLIATHRGKVIYQKSAGYADAEKTRPAALDDLYWVCSITKVTTCVSAMRLVEQGLLKLEDPVSKYLPAFGNLTVKNPDGSVTPAKTPMTILHLFTMSGGLDYDLSKEPIKRVCENRQAGTQEVVSAFAESPLLFEPGTHYRYSLCHDVLAAVVEVVSGMRYADYVKKYITDPLGMQDTGFHLPPEKAHRISAMYRYRHGYFTAHQIPAELKYCLTDNYDSGGAGLYTSAADQIKLMTALALGGTSPDGYRLLRPETVELMGKEHLPYPAKPDIFPTRLYGYSYGLCCRCHVDPTVSLSPSSVGEFGWDGATGPFALVDAKRQVAIYYTQHIFGCGYVYHAIHPRIRDLIYEQLPD